MLVMLSNVSQKTDYNKKNSGIENKITTDHELPLLKNLIR